MSYGAAIQHRSVKSIHSPHIYIFMITVSVNICNPISQDFYDNTLNALPLHMLTCTCGLSGCLSIHGYYYRSIKSGTSSIRLRICRVRCSHCGRTHAILLSSMVPFSSIPLASQVDIISHSETDHDYSDILDSTPSIDESNVRSIIRRFKQHWKQRLLSQNIPLSDIPALISRCFLHFFQQFMQIKRIHNILFSPPT